MKVILLFNDLFFLLKFIISLLEYFIIFRINLNFRDDQFSCIDQHQRIDLDLSNLQG